MTSSEKMIKIKSIINSCTTLKQLDSCFSFVEREEFFRHDDPKDVTLYRWEIIYTLQRKLYHLKDSFV